MLHTTRLDRSKHTCILSLAIMSNENLNVGFFLSVGDHRGGNSYLRSGDKDTRYISESMMQRDRLGGGGMVCMNC